MLQGKLQQREWSPLNCPIYWRLTLCSEHLCHEISLWLPTSCWLLSRDLKSWHRQDFGRIFFFYFFVFIFSSGSRLKTKSWDFLGCHCLFKNMSAFYWVVFVLLLKPRGVLRRDLRFTPFAWQFNVKNRRCSTSGASVLPPKKQTARQKARLGGHQSSSKTYLNCFFLRSLCCRLSQGKKRKTLWVFWVFWSFLLFLSSTFSFVTAGD